MTYRWSFNINGQNVPNWQQLLEWGKLVKPTFTLVMDNRAKARQWKDTVGGEVIFRQWDVTDNFYHQHVNPQTASQNCAHDLGDNKDLWVYYKLNEPGGSWNAIQDWIVAFAEYNRQKGIKTTSCGLAIMKNWANPEFVQSGAVDKLIRYAYEHQDTFIIDVHEYVTGLAWSSHTPNYPANLFDHTLSLQGEQTAKIVWDNYSDNWYLGRVGWVTNVRAMQLVGDVLPFVITEALFDWHSSVHQQTLNGQNVGDMLKNAYGDVRYNRDVRGVMGSRRLFEWLATGNANVAPDDNRFVDVIIRNFQWTENNYPENCKGIMLFTMNPDWDIPEGHHYGRIANALLPKMATNLKMRDTIIIQPPPQETPMLAKRIKIVSSNVRVRSSASLAGAFIGWITNTDWQDALVGETTITKDGYVWRQIEIGTLKGYSAFESTTGTKLLDMQNIPVTEPPPAYTANELALIEAYRAKDLQAIFALIEPQLLFHDLTIGQATIAVPKPFMPLLAEVIHALGDYVENDEGVL